MNFGKVENLADIDFTLPPDHADTVKLLLSQSKTEDFEVCVGCAKWNKKDLKNFYPKGTKDELSYYASQFNSIELNATFYTFPKKEQVIEWKEKTPPGFKFFPKIYKSISHFRKLNDIKPFLDDYCDAVTLFEEKLGMVFLQLHDHFSPKNFDRLEKFVSEFPSHLPLAVEVRNQDWFKDNESAERYYNLLEKYNATNILVDTAGRRDLLHMRLTTPLHLSGLLGLIM